MRLKTGKGGGNELNRFHLSNEWPEMLQGLRGLGRLLVLTRNESAVIARFMEYPELAFDRLDRGRAIAVSEEASDQFDLDFSNWRFAHARHSRMPKGHGYAVEFLDGRRQAFHSVVLTQESHFPGFTEWLREHRVAAGPSGGEAPPLFSRSGAAPLKPAREGADRDRPFCPGQLLPLLRGMVEAGLPMRAVAGHEAIVQGHCFRADAVRESGSWIFCSNEETGLHFDLSGIARAVLHPVRLHGCGGSVLKAYHANGRLLFFIAPTASGHLPAWNRLLRDCAIQP